MLTHAIRFSAHGGPEVLRWEALELPDPGPGEIRIRHHAIGVNFIDTYHRTGLYPVPLPSGLGQEGAGVVEAVGPGVTEFRPGDRVAYCGGALDGASPGQHDGRVGGRRARAAQQTQSGMTAGAKPC